MLYSCTHMATVGFKGLIWATLYTKSQFVVCCCLMLLVCHMCIIRVVVVAFDEKLIVYDACRFRERFTITGHISQSPRRNAFCAMGSIE